MNKLPIREMKNILEYRIDYSSSITQQAMNKLGLTQRSLQRMSYLEYMTTSTSQQDYFLYLHAIALNIKKLHQEIAKMTLKDKSIDCTDPGNVDEIIALLDQRMNQTQIRQHTQEKESRQDKRIIKFTKSAIKSITERTLIPQKQNSLSPDRNNNINNIKQHKFIISNNQSVAEIKNDEQQQLNDSTRKQDKNIVIISGIRNRLKENNCTKSAIDDFMKRIAKLRSVSQQSIDSGRKLPSTIIKLKKNSNIMSTKLELMLKKERLIREEPLKINQIKIGNIMGVISKIRNQKSKEKMFQQLNL